MKRYKIFSKKTIIAGSVILISFLFILMAFAPALSGAGQIGQPAVAEKSYIPNPTLNTNITWNTFYHGYKPLEYNNGTGNQTLNTGLSTFYKNPISVNPAQIIANGTLENDKLGTETGIWENTSSWTNHSNTNDTSYAKIATSNGHIEIEGDTSPEAGTNAQFGTYIQIANYPSNNLQYDYITIIYGLSGTAITGVNGVITLWNSTAYGSQIGSTIYPGEVGYISENLAQFQKDNGYSTTFNTTGTGTSTDMEINPALNMPESTTTEDYTLTIYGLAFTSYPMTLGTNSTGKVVSQSTGNAELSSFAPSFPWTEVVNNGYSVAVSQTMQNITESQTSISDGSYIEQATYQGTLELPTAPGLTYGNTNISLNMTLPGKQYEVATLNGASYLSEVQAKDNGTYYFGTVNPNTPNSMILEAKYTASQWDASTHAPSFFTLRGLEYYWWVGVIGGLSIIGLGAAASAHWGGEEDDLKVPKGKFGR